MNIYVYRTWDKFYNTWDKFELDVKYDEKQGKRKFLGICSTELQTDVDNLIDVMLSTADVIDLNELYKYLLELSQGEITLESYLTGVTNVLDDLRM